MSNDDDENLEQKQRELPAFSRAAVTSSLLYKSMADSNMLAQSPASTMLRPEGMRRDKPVNFSRRPSCLSHPKSAVASQNDAPNTVTSITLHGAQFKPKG